MPSFKLLIACCVGLMLSLVSAGVWAATCSVKLEFSNAWKINDPLTNYHGTVYLYDPSKLTLGNPTPMPTALNVPVELPTTFPDNNVSNTVTFSGDCPTGITPTTQVCVALSYTGPTNADVNYSGNGSTSSCVAPNRQVGQVPYYASMIPLDGSQTICVAEYGSTCGSGANMSFTN